MLVPETPPPPFTNLSDDDDDSIVIDSEPSSPAPATPTGPASADTNDGSYADDSDYEGMPGLMSVSSDSDDDDRAAATVADIRPFIQDFLEAALPNLRDDQLRRDRDLQARRLDDIDAEMLLASMYGSWSFISNTFGKGTGRFSESQFRATARQLIPAFEAIEAHIRRHGEGGTIQFLGADDHIDVDAVLVFLHQADILKRMHMVETKLKARSINRVQGYAPPQIYDHNDTILAHEAHSCIRLTLAQHTRIPVPIPVHLIRDAFASARFAELCMPGTHFLEHVPVDVERARKLFNLCFACGGYHIWITPRDCRNSRLEDRILIAPHYKLYALGNSPTEVFFMPITLTERREVVAHNYLYVYPGSLFLFGRVPPAIVEARERVNACTECGIAHNVVSNSTSRCPYNLAVLAERFVKLFHASEHCLSDFPYTSLA